MHLRRATSIMAALTLSTALLACGSDPGPDADPANPVTIDVTGYSVPTADDSKGQSVDITNARLLDTRTGSGVSLPNPGDSKNCTDFSKWEVAHAWYWSYRALYGDVADLDANDDGVVCEALWDRLRVKPATTQPVGLFKTNGKNVVKSTVDVSGTDEHTRSSERVIRRALTSGSSAKESVRM